MSVRPSVRRAQSAVICNKSTADCARFFFQNETRIDMSGAIGGNAQSTRLFHRRTRRQCAIDACFAGAIGSNSIKVPFLPKNFKANRLKKRLILQ